MYKHEFLWEEEWTKGNVVNKNLVTNPCQIVEGMHLLRCLWATISRIRTSHRIGMHIYYINGN